MKRFTNPTPTETHGVRGFLKWQVARNAAKWPAPRQDPPRTLPKAADDALQVTFVNHATVLLQVDGLAILTDPIWSDRCSPVPFAGPKRYQDPGIAFDDLPPIDLVLISHDHYDHLDAATVRALVARNPHTRFATGLGNGKLLRKLGANHVDELAWWQASGIVTFVPAQHFSGRGLVQNKTLWGGFVVQTSHGPVFFAGDTGFGPHFAAVRERCGPMRLALLPIGAYAPRWYMAPVHMDPFDAVQAHLALGATESMGIHFGTFQLTDEAQDQPALDLARAMADAGVAPAAFWVPEFGETRATRRLPALSENGR